MRQNVEEIFFSGDNLFINDVYHLFHVAKLNYESRSTLLRHKMNVRKGLCIEKMCLLIYHLRKEPMAYQ